MRRLLHGAPQLVVRELHRVCDPRTTLSARNADVAADAACDDVVVAGQDDAR